MRLHILVEGPSEKVFLDTWLPRFLPKQHGYKVYTHRGKGRLNNKDLSASLDPKRQGLLDQLPAKLRAWDKSLDSATDRVLVLVDADDEPCEQLKKRVAKAIQVCSPTLVALVRVAVEETEAFFMGDWRAIKSAYPRANQRRLSAYRPDEVCGTWELLRDVIGAPAESEAKIEWALQIGEHLGTTPMDSQQGNRSPSFQHFCAAIMWLVGEITDRDPELLKGRKRRNR